MATTTQVSKDIIALIKSVSSNAGTNLDNKDVNDSTILEKLLNQYLVTSVPLLAVPLPPDDGSQYTLSYVSDRWTWTIVTPVEQGDDGHGDGG